MHKKLGRPLGIAILLRLQNSKNFYKISQNIFVFICAYTARINTDLPILFANLSSSVTGIHATMWIKIVPQIQLNKRYSKIEQMGRRTKDALCQGHHLVRSLAYPHTHFPLLTSVLLPLLLSGISGQCLPA